MTMKITINIAPERDDPEITVSCSRLTPEIEKIIASLRMLENRLTVRADGAIHILDPFDALYMESVERRTFVYTKGGVYETDLRLYELEEKLSDRYFLRVSKSCIVNLKKIKTLKTDLDRRIRITMDNGEQIIASRTYADELRKKLGVK